MKKLAIITSHPIQYNAPLFQLLAERNKIQIKVFYTWSQAIDQVEDLNFGKTIKWDVPLLDGYDFQVVKNISKTPGSHHRKGIINPSLLSDIKKWQPNSVLVYGWNFVSHFQVMKYFKGKIPVLFRGDSTLMDETGGVKTIIRRFYLNWVYKHVDNALYVGTNNKKYFIKHGLSEKQLIFAPHSIDNQRFSDNTEKKYEQKAIIWLRELGYNNDDIIILFAGKFEKKKNPEILINAINQIPNLRLLSNYTAAKQITKTPNPQIPKSPDPQIPKSPNHQIIKLLMVGNGVLEEKLKNLAKDNPNIKFLPFQNQSQMPLLYRVADVYCLPSKGPGETWGLAVNEAMACCRPVIISDKVGCAVDLIKEGHNGWIFKHDDIKNLVDKIQKAASDKENLKSMGNNAEKFIAKWSFEKIAEAIETLLHH